MDLISSAFEKYEVLGGFTGDTEVHFSNRAKASLKDLASNPNAVYRAYAMDRVAVPTIVGMPRMLGYTSIIELEITNLFKVKVGLKQGFYSSDGNILMADQIELGDQLMGMTPTMFEHADAGSEMVYSYLANAYFRVTKIDKTPKVEPVYSLTSPRHNRFILANGLMVQAAPRPKINKS